MIPPDGIKNQAIQNLKKLRVFEGLQDWEYEKIYGLCKAKFFHSGENIFNQGDEENSLYVLLSGEVEIVVDGVGVVHVISGNEVLGEMGLVCDAPRSASAVSKKPTMILRLESKELHELMRLNTRIGYVVMRNIAMALAERLNAQNS